jgi:hypothetical protein
LTSEQQAPSTKHQAASSKQQAASRKQKAASSKQQLTPLIHNFPLISIFLFKRQKIGGYCDWRWVGVGISIGQYSSTFKCKQSIVK